MAITFGGLATGLDTNSIVSELMKFERRPIDRLNVDKSYLTSRQAAFTSFDSKLTSFLSTMETLETADGVVAQKAALSDAGYFTASLSAEAQAGNYSVEVASLARQEKEVADGVASDYAVTTGGDLVLNGQAVTIAAGMSLAEIRDAVNATADIGVSASIIDDGTAAPKRLLLTADEAGADGVAIGPGSTFSELSFVTTQAGSDAHVIVDGIDIYSTSNTLSEAIAGVTLELVQEGELLQAQDSIAIGNPPRDIYTSIGLSVSQDDDGIKKNVESFVDGYNGIVDFITGQKGADWGSDSRFSSVKRRLQSLLTTAVGGTGAFSTLSEIGLETQRDGKIELNSTAFNEVLKTQVDDLQKLFAGETDSEGTVLVEGVASRFSSYLDSITDATTGIMASSKEMTESRTRYIEDRIAQMELRLEKKEETMRAQFSAMEELVSSLNTQSSYLAQQMTALNSMVSGSK